MVRWRRYYAPGRCQDCGHWRRVTVARFWLGFLRYVLCAECIRAYRPQLLTRTPKEQP